MHLESTAFMVMILRNAVMESRGGRSNYCPPVLRCTGTGKARKWPLLQLYSIVTEISKCDARLCMLLQLLLQAGLLCNVELCYQSIWKVAQQ